MPGAEIAARRGTHHRLPAPMGHQPRRLHPARQRQGFQGHGRRQAAPRPNFPCMKRQSSAPCLPGLLFRQGLGGRPSLLIPLVPRVLFLRGRKGFLLAPLPNLCGPPGRSLLLLAARADINLRPLGQRVNPAFAALPARHTRRDPAHRTIRFPNHGHSVPLSHRTLAPPRGGVGPMPFPVWRA